MDRTEEPSDNTRPKRQSRSKGDSLSRILEAYYTPFVVVGEGAASK
jgi:hypothetical protein